MPEETQPETKTVTSDDRLDQIERQLELRLKLLSASLALGGAIVIGLLAGFTWEYKSENTTYKFELSADTIVKLAAIGLPAVTTGGAISWAVQSKVKS